MNRELMVRAYAILMPLAALSVVVQAILFAGRYSEGQSWYLTAHMHVGSASLLIVVICLGLAIFGRFPQATRILPLTVILVLLWLGQYLLGEYSDKVRWLSFPSHTHRLRCIRLGCNAHRPGSPPHGRQVRRRRGLRVIEKHTVIPAKVGIQKGKRRRPTC